MKQESAELSYRGRGRGETEEEKGEEQLHDDWEKLCDRAGGEHMHAATGSSKSPCRCVCVCVQMSEGAMW